MYQLRTFWEVSRADSITRAGRRLGYSQSTVTSHIRALEAQAGAVLFQRLPHGVRLTEAGVIFHRHAARVLSVIDELTGELAAEGEVQGRVSVGAAAFLIDQDATRLIWECRYRYPRVEVAPVSMDSGRIVEEVAAGKLDVGLVLALPGDSGRRQLSGLATEDLHHIDVVCVASPGLVGPGGELVGLSSARILQVDPTCASQDALRNALESRYDVHLDAMAVGSVGGVLELMRNGPFVAMLPEQAVAREIAAGDVQVLDLLPKLRPTVRMVWSETSWQPPAVSALLELARRLGQGRRPAGPVSGAEVAAAC